MEAVRFRNGLEQVRLKHISGRWLWCYVHELVAETFVPNPNNYQYVKHKDGNKLNNHAVNLMWVATFEET